MRNQTLPCLATLALLAACGSPETPAKPEAPANSVAANGITLTSVATELPVEEQYFPDGPGADLLNANCTACHSASMALNQPRLTTAQWQETVTKMRKVYLAPIADADVAAIVGYLEAMQPVQEEGLRREGG